VALRQQAQAMAGALESGSLHWVKVADRFTICTKAATVPNTPGTFRKSTMASWAAKPAGSVAAAFYWSTLACDLQFGLPSCPFSRYAQ